MFLHNVVTNSDTPCIFDMLFKITAIRSGLDVLGFEPQWGRGEIFLTFPDRPWGPPNLLYKGYGVSFTGINWPRRGDDHPPPSNTEVKGRV
jgi:hypothetical protein